MASSKLELHLYSLQSAETRASISEQAVGDLERRCPSRGSDGSAEPYMHRLNGLRVIGTVQNEQGWWSAVQYTASGGRWYILDVLDDAHTDLTGALVDASTIAFQLSRPYLQGLREERDVSDEDVIEILGPLEALALAQEP